MAQLRNSLDGYVVGGVERLATGFRFTEGPVWNPDGYLLFSDMPGDIRRRWAPADGVTVVREPANKCNGMAYDRLGRLLVCEHATSRLVRESRSGEVEVLADRYDGAELNSPNDVVVSFDDTIFFSDPTYGRMPGFGVERDPELGFRGVYRLEPGGVLHLVDDDFDQPNGLCFSPDESILYVNDTVRGTIVSYPRRSDGTLGGRDAFAEQIGVGEAAAGGVVDGMKCDAEGNVLVTGPGGIWVLDPDGDRIGVIEVPEVCGNLNWGGPGWSTLFITASTSVYRVETSVAGAPVPNMRRIEMVGGEDG